MFQSLVPDKPSNTLDLVFMYYLWNNFLNCPFQVELTIFVLIAVSFRLISVYSGVIPASSGTFRYHSWPFRLIPAPFLSIPFHSGVILPGSGIFRLIPVYSVPFHSVPVFSNARLCSLYKPSTYLHMFKSHVHLIQELTA